MKFNGPFCKDCAHYRADKNYLEEPDTDYWNGIRRMNAKCAIDLPDFITDKGDIKLTNARGDTDSTCWVMRTSGPCGLRGYLFEAAPK